MTWQEEIRAHFPGWGTEQSPPPGGEKSDLELGQPVSGVVIARAPFGVWLDLGVGRPALLLVPEMEGANERRIRFEDYPALGERVHGRIQALGPNGEIGLTQHPGNVRRSPRDRPSG